MKPAAIAVLSLIGLLPILAAAAPAQSYSIDQTRYFTTPEIESAQRKPLMDEAASFPAVAPVDPVALADYLQRAEVLLAKLERHSAYLHLRASKNIDDQAAADADDRINSATDLLIVAVGTALRTLGGTAFAKSAAVNPVLNRYAFLLAQAERNLPHQLPKEQQAIIDELADPTALSFWNLYQQTVRSTPFVKLSTADGVLDVRSDARLLALNPDRAIRHAAWQGRWDGYVSRADIYAGYGRGLLGDSRVIMHEGGHAIHRQLMIESGVSPFYTSGPNWMFEAFAILDEFLLYDHLYQTSMDPKARVYYLEALIDDMTHQIFTSAEEGTLEQSIYDGVVAGRISNAADLDALSLSIWSKYEIWPASEPQLAHIWTTKSLMYQDPLYLVNYLYAGLLATKMFDMVKHDPADFQKRYSDLLRKGFYAPPGDLLRSFFGHDLSQQELVDDGMNILTQRIDALAESYQKMDIGH